MDSPSPWDMRRFLLVFLFIGACVVAPAAGWTATEETSLRSVLETNYEDAVRPEEITVVYIAFQMTTIEGVDIKSQTFSVSGWWVLKWNDPRLAWTPASNGNIEDVQLDQDDIWTPAIVITNSVSDLTAIDEDTIPLRVHYNGDVHWHPPGIFTVGCEMDTTHFPFDTQTCSMEVSSVGYTLSEVDVNSTRGVLTQFYHESGDWEVLGMWEDRDTYYDLNNEYARITFSVKIKRLNVYHWLNIIMPVIISGILVMFVFLLPVDSGEKMGYSLTCLLTYVVLLTLIAQDMPTTAKHTSILEVYLTTSLIMSGFSVFCACLSIKLYQTPDDALIPRLVVRMVKKCWPWVDWRKDIAKPSGGDNDKHNNRKTNGVHPAGEGIGKYQKEKTVLSPRAFAEKERGLRTPVRRLSLASVSSNDDYSEDLIDGKVCSLVMDAVLFRVSVVFIPVLTLIFLIALAVE